MPQIMDSPSISDHEATAPGKSSPTFRGQEAQYHYHPIPLSAIIGLVLAVLSLTALATWKGIPLAVIAVIVSLVAFLRIWRADGEYSGKWLSVSGLAVSVFCGVAGLFLEAQRLRNEIPPGFQRVSFVQEIASQEIGMEEKEGRLLVVPSPLIQELVGKKIYVKGYMYPTNQKTHLTQFLICKDNAQCCFGGQPATTDMIGVTMKDLKTADYDDSLMGIAGTFQINEHYTGGSLEPLYLIEAEHVAPALSSL